MSFRWKARKSSRSNLRRLARNQLLAAINELEAPFADRADAIHEARLHLKKLRALVRLVREAAPQACNEENASLRDIARALSTQRDRQALIDALNKLERHAEREWGEPSGELDAIQKLRDRFIESQHQESNGAGFERLVEKVAEQLRQALSRVEDWTSAARNDRIVSQGFAESYRRGRRALRAVLAGPTAENLHEWRKQIKYHRYQVRLFQAAWPTILEAHYEELKRLSDLLGDDHDLVVLEHAIGCGCAADLDADALDRLRMLIHRRRDELQAEAVPLGRLLFAEKPNRLTERFMRYWCTYRETNQR
ncbi:MAG TPA: CHAD domain-containing protein [Pirellulales bacterium]|jgi:CHAD domain-containing protein|nr:CHAD domain-containing protein [Pirellulales bacterium]